MGTITDVASARVWLREARAIAVLTGAGMSAESGVPTFRDAQTGLWAKFRPEELATESAFRANPTRVWDWYAERREGVAQVVIGNLGGEVGRGAELHHPGVEEETAQQKPERPEGQSRGAVAAHWPASLLEPATVHS